MDRLFTPVKRQNHPCAGAPEARRCPVFAGLRRPRGFTLVELVVTMIVVGILAVVVVPKFSLLSGFDEVGYRDKVKATIEFARKAAVAQRRFSCVSVSTNDLLLTIDQNIPEAYVAGCPANSLSLPTTDNRCSPSASNKICAPNGVALAGPPSLQFSPLGRPSAAGTYTINGTAWTITVEAETGYVH